MSEYTVPKTMSTQHPDNVTSPFFAHHSLLRGDDEIKEAFYAYSHLDCKEQLWDCEGKETDSYVVKKLLTGYEPFFKKNTLGKDFFLTLRVPNPGVEKAEAKILLETLESIPRSFDTAKLFYGEDISPIFEVALPMASSAQGLLQISRYYKDHVIGKKHTSLAGMKISDWIGDFNPERVNVIPLFEEKESMLGAAQEVGKYLDEEKVDTYQRVWLARSDPALNYGSLASVLIEKIALQRLRQLQEEKSIDILPILGCGSAPFRGNLRPDNVDSMLKGYPSIHTYTLQSAFKYDFDVQTVEKGIKQLNELKTSAPITVDESTALPIIEKLEAEYQNQIQVLAPLINEISSFIPNRRARKLHIGLFGYSREMKGIKLPRAIKFCGALYSIGIPPDLLGLNALSDKELEIARSVYPSFEQDMKDALQWLNKDNFEALCPEVYEKVKSCMNIVDVEPDRDHHKITSIILDNYRQKHNTVLMENIERAGFIRKFLG